MGRWMERKFQSGSRLQVLVQTIIDQTFGVTIFFPLYFVVYEIIGACVSGQGMLNVWYDTSIHYFNNELETCMLLTRTNLRTRFITNYYHELLVPDLRTAWRVCRAELPAILLTQYKVWPFVNWINFTYVPEPLRVLVSAVVALFWNVYLTAKVAGVGRVIL
jgi:hypothetical protein